MTRDVRVFVADVLESISRIEEYCRGFDSDRFLADGLVQDAVFRRLEVIGEAVKGIPDEVRAKYPQIPWKQIAGLRDVLIHGYFGVKVERIWTVIQDDLPGFKEVMTAIQNDLAQ